MTVRNVRYVRLSELTPEQKKELKIEESMPDGIVAIEAHNSNYEIKGVLIKRGIVDYILNGA